MLGLWNRLVQLPEERLTTKIFNWDQAHSYPCSREGAEILSLSDLNYIYRNNLQCNINTGRSNGRRQSMKPKLRNYIQIKDDYHTELYIKLNVQRRQRSLCA